jgi:small subunit ribosomal protein S18
MSETPETPQAAPAAPAADAPQAPAETPAASAEDPSAEDPVAAAEARIDGGIRAKRPARRKRRSRDRFMGRRKVSRLTTDKTVVVDYKNLGLLKTFLSPEGKILPRRITGNTAKQQRQIALAVKRARHIALLPFSPPDI